jgi:hypothetical protein
MDTGTLWAFRASYFIPILPGCPTIPGIPDCQWAFAFGRGSYLDKDLGKILEQMGAGSMPDIAVFENLKRDNFKAGRTNEHMAAVGLKNFLHRNLPLAGQWEALYAMWNLNQAIYEKHVDAFHSVWAPKDKDYYPTSDVAEDLGKYSGRKRYHSPLLLTHAAHTSRVVAVCWKQGWYVMVENNDIIWTWDHQSIQPVTQRFMGLHPRNCWIFREAIVRPHHVVFGLATLTPPPPLGWIPR